MTPPGPQDRARLAGSVAVWVAAWGFALAALTLELLFELPAEPLPGLFLSEAPVEVRTLAADIDVTVALIYGPVAALLLARRPHPVAFICAIYAVGSGIAAFGIQYSLLAARVGSLPLWEAFAYAGGWAFVPGTFLVPLVPLMITTGRRPAWQRAVIAASCLIALAATFISLTQQTGSAVSNPAAIRNSGYQAFLAPLYTTLSALALAVSLLAFAVVVSRWFRTRGHARAGWGWLAAGQLFITLSYVAQALPADLDLPTAVTDFALLSPVIGQIVYPAAILVVVLNQRLWGVELVVSRVLLWALLSATGVLLYLAVVAAVPLALGSAGPASLIAPLIVALTVLPLRGWLQRRIDHLVYGDGADPPHLVARLGDRIGELPPGPEGIQSLAHTLRAVLRLGWVRIEADGIDASSGRRRDTAALALPLPGGQAGTLHAQPLPGQGLDRRTRTVLGDVAGLVATVVRLAQSYAVLDAARASLAARRAEERRAVRRELHDGLGPALAGIGFGLAAVENLAGSPERARALLRELADDVRASARDVRALADAVSPPRAGDTDLVGALHRLTRRFDSPQLRVTASLPPTLALPGEHAEALYFIAAEAVSNAARHSGAGSVSIRLRDTTGGAELEVADDGAGIPPHAPTGVGMSSMRERARGVGGSLTISTDPAGTTVVAQVGGARPIEEDTT